MDVALGVVAVAAPPPVLLVVVDAPLPVEPSTTAVPPQAPARAAANNQLIARYRMALAYDRFGEHVTKPWPS